MVTKKGEMELCRQLRESSAELSKAEERIHQLDTIISRLYEDNISGKVSDERFVKMSASYEAEQKTLDLRVSELRAFISDTREQRLQTKSFLGLVRKYSVITELTPEIVRAFVEKIVMHQSEKVSGTRTKKQTIVIFWNSIGVVDIPDDYPEMQEKTA